MEKDVYYYKPNVPMFVFIDQGNLTRVKAIRYVNGKMHSILADWDFWNIQTEFYDVLDSDPFYCLFKTGDGKFSINENLLEWIFKGLIPGRTHFDNFDEFLTRALESAEILGCPIFDNEDDARKYVYHNSIL